MRFSEFDFDVITSPDEALPAKAPPAEQPKPRAGNEPPNAPKPRSENRAVVGSGSSKLHPVHDR